MHVRVFSVAVIVCLATLPLHAQWNADPHVRNPISTGDSIQRYPGMCSDGKGGAIIAYEDLHIDSSNVYLYMQRIDDRGYTLWRTNGRATTSCREDNQHKPRLCSDGAGGAIMGYYSDISTRQLYAQRMDSSGNAMWGCEGIKVNNTATVSELLGVFSDHAGGAYFVWTLFDYNPNPPHLSIFVTRLDKNGTPVWSAPTTAVYVLGNISYPTAGSDTLGNVFVGWLEYFAPDYTIRFRVQKVTPGGFAAWGPSGCAPVDTNASAGAVAGDNTGGAFTMTAYATQNGLAAISRISPAGALSWSTRTSATHRTGTPAVVPDGFGGAIGVSSTTPPPMSTERVMLVMQRVNSAGTPLWATGGLTVTDAAGQSIGQYGIVNDGAGGVIAAWQENAIVNPNLYAQHVDSNGLVAWGPGGKTVCNEASRQLGMLAVRDFPQQVICTWTDYRDTGTRADIYAAKLGDPWHVVTDTVLDFGRVNVTDTGRITKARFQSNIGVEDLNVPSDNITGTNKDDFAVSNDTTDLMLAYRDSRDLQAIFTPTTIGAKTADLKFVSNTKFPSPVVHLKGRGVLPGVTTIPQVDFGNQSVGVRRDSVIVRIIRSTGSGFLHVDSLRIAGASGAYSIDSGNVSPFVLDSGQTLTLKIGFLPLVRGRVLDTLYVYGNTPTRGMVRFVGTGTKGSLALAGSELDFGNVVVGVPKDSTVAAFALNSGTGPVVVESMSLHGGDSIEFSVSNPLGSYVVPPGNARPATMRFVPLIAGPRSSTLVVVTGDGDTLTYGVRGNGVTAQARHAVLQLTSDQVDMGDTLVGMRRDSVLSAWVGNVGDTTLTVSRMSMLGANASEFSADDSTLSFSVEPGNTHPLTLHFSPLSAGTKTAHLDFTWNGASAAAIMLTGRAHGSQGVGVLATASSVFDCGSSGVAVPRSVPRQGFVHNTGTAALTVSGMTIAGVNPGDFAVTSPQTFTLGAGDSVGVTVLFVPSSIGPRTANLTIASDVGDALVKLTGTGTSSKLAVSVASIDFGSVPVGGTRDSMVSAFIQNTGTDTATVTGAQYAGADGASFTTIALASPLKLAPQASAAITIRFAPLRTGVHNGEIVIVGASDTVRATLTGRGVRLLRLRCANVHGTPGTSVLVPVSVDSAASGTSVRGIDMEMLFTPDQFYPESIETTGSATAGWTFSPPTISGGVVAIHGTGTQAPGASTLLFQVRGTILQSSVVQAPVSLRSPVVTGDLDVTMNVQSAGTITMDTLCGYGRQTFSVRTAPLLVWQPAPNPAKDEIHLHIRTAQSGTVSVEVRDERGRPIHSEHFAQPAGDHEWSITSAAWTPGVYVVTIASAGVQETRRVIVAR